MSAGIRSVETQMAYWKPGRADLHLAWFALAFVPLAFIAAMFVGDWLLNVQGYGSDQVGSVPMRPALLAGSPAVLLIVVPALVGMGFGVRSRSLGNRDGLAPALAGGVIAAATLLMNVAAFFAAG